MNILEFNHFFTNSVEYLKLNYFILIKMKLSLIIIVIWLNISVVLCGGYYDKYMIDRIKDMDNIHFGENLKNK